jgi:tRNA G18 (ribose-2'-O)-methylase SpoU
VRTHSSWYIVLGTETILQSIFQFVSGCVDMWDSKVMRAAAGSHFRLPIHRNIEFSDIDKLIDDDCGVFLADNNTIGNYKRGETLEDISVPILPYSDANFTDSKSIVVVIGGETEGLSGMAMRLARMRNGHRLHIPLNNCVESLNTGTALGVILFEIKRQFAHFF